MLEALLYIVESKKSGFNLEASLTTTTTTPTQFHDYQKTGKGSTTITTPSNPMSLMVLCLLRRAAHRLLAGAVATFRSMARSVARSGPHHGACADRPGSQNSG